MNSRKRFLQTMRYEAPDHAPLFREGIRDEVVEEWRQQGLAGEEQLDEMFSFDRRQEISLDLEPRQNLVELAGLKDGLERLRDDLDDLSRLPERWQEHIQGWRERQHVLMLMVHEGFFLSLGVGDWKSFARAMYLLADRPEFVRQAMFIYGAASARMLEIFLKEVEIDAAVFSEPIGGNHGPLVSPETYATFVLPSYDPILDVLKRNGVDTIIFRTYANTKLLLPLVLDRGFNCLWAVETDPVAMDYLLLRQEFGSQLRLIGGIDLDVLLQGKDAICRELERVVPPLLIQGRYAPLADGRVRANIPFENYAFYRRLLEQMTHS
jgi:hypothetical protein